MSSDRIRMSVAEARDHAERAMRGIGYDAEEAYILADHAIDAALCGYEYSGLAKLLNIPEHRRFKQPRWGMRVLRETEVSALYDGGNNVGMVVLYRVARAAIAKAATRGFAVVGVTDSWMSGRSAYYVEMIAKPDLLAGLNGFKQQLSALIDRIKATPRQPGVSEIRMPGERAFRSREKGLRDGIEIDRLVYEALARLHA
jgi:LDH2 family malate/lactate/ureidoglycolate dehydrogenase